MGSLKIKQNGHIKPHENELLNKDQKLIEGVSQCKGPRQVQRGNQNATVAKEKKGNEESGRERL